MAEAEIAAAAAPRPTLAERMAKNADGVLEQIARDYTVPTFEVARHLPAAHRTITNGAHFASVMGELTAWGEILLIVHTSDVVIECAGSIPPGTFGRGYFNLHGESPIGGHIKAAHCTHIVFVDRPFMGRVSKSIQFFNGSGEAMFKVFVRRDENREFVSEQAAKFDALQTRYRELDGDDGQATPASQAS